jgi:ATP-binding cassette subfamily B protein
MNNSLVASLRSLVSNLPQRRRSQLLLLLGVMLLGAMAEVISLGAIVPFLAILADPEQALVRPELARLLAGLGLHDAQDLRWYFTLIFATTALAAGLLRFVLIYVTAKVTYGIGHELGAEVYRRTLYQPYEIHVARNSSEIIGVINKVDVIVWLISGMLNLVSAITISIFIVSALVLIDPQVAIATLIGFSSIYVIVSLVTRRKLAQNSDTISATIDLRVLSVQEGLGGMRDVLLDHSQELFLRRFNQVDWPLRQAQASNNIIGPSPRFAIEALGMVLIALLGYYMTAKGGGIATALPTLGVLALGAQRLMPLLQMSYQGWVFVAGNRLVLEDVITVLNQPVPVEAMSATDQLPFLERIRFEEVSFRYQVSFPLVLNKLNLSITKGARLGIIGATGSGKSTLMDLLMGLLQPTAGQISIDNVPLTNFTRLTWQRNVAHVPQAIFLADATFTENIAFGIEPKLIDMDRVRHAAQRAQIAQFIESSALGYATTVGERGVRLSGGQRQRIAIARALYKQATILVFDEATSALDTETEQAVMEAIEGLGREITIVLIAHRLSTLKNCTQIVELSGGNIKRSGSYHEIMSHDRMRPCGKISC